MIVYYHNACPDGWCAAWVAKRKYPDAKLVALDHGLTLEQLDSIYREARGQDVLMVDYSLRTREANDELARVANSFRILDHHKSAKEVLAGAPYATFDMNRSGAGLAWDHLFGVDCKDRPFQVPDEPGQVGYLIDRRPWFIDYVEARDLWRWDSVPNAKAICAYIGALPFTIEDYDNLVDSDQQSALLFGSGALAHIDHFVRETIKNVRFGYLLGHEVAILNATYLNCSEIGNELAKEAEFSITWFERKDDVIQFSLRSIGEMDVSAIAKQFQGGGHKNAAGFQLPYESGRRLIDQILRRGSNYEF
jgi:oligoribonuclease NrnB/cAMP/cGMP phosphodiesterase (DHH superfamily)